MNASRNAVIVRDGQAPESGGQILQWDDLKTRVRSRAIWRDLLRYQDATLLTQDLDRLMRPFLAAALTRSLSRGTAHLEDRTGRRVQVTLAFLTRQFGGLVRDQLAEGALVRRVKSHLAESATSRTRIQPQGAPVYLRTDLVFGLESGGSVGHIAGVLNGLRSIWPVNPLFLTTDRIATVDEATETSILPPSSRFRNQPHLHGLASNNPFFIRAKEVLRSRSVAFVYQRYCMDNYLGPRLAADLSVPFVLEYNGSEVWVNRNWGGRRGDYRLAERIELFDLQRADVVVVVSDPLREELVARGIDEEKILVNPNGVDTDRYSLSVSGAKVRERLGLERMLVIGFIGTFGPWHGAEVLADAFARLIARDPSLRDRVRLLMIGDGPTLAETRRRLEIGGAIAETVFAGRTRQEDGPAYLAACDILVSPHVPNADGSRFFGSPTKLFEYMAMGKPIVASDLEQIGEVLEHDRTAWLVPAGDPDALADGLNLLLQDPDRRDRVGTAAREDAVAHHTWRAHTQRTLDKLVERCG
jgi:glycosyltransferase involved in cell wall biosynthesis